jgi:hypothetical protein
VVRRTSSFLQRLWFLPSRPCALGCCYSSTTARQSRSSGPLGKRAIKRRDIRRDREPVDLPRALIGVSHVAYAPDWQQAPRDSWTSSSRVRGQSRNHEPRVPYTARNKHGPQLIEVAATPTSNHCCQATLFRHLLRRGRSDHGPSPLSRPPRSLSRTSPGHPSTRTLPRVNAVGSANRRSDRHACQSI